MTPDASVADRRRPRRSAGQTVSFTIIGFVHRSAPRTPGTVARGATLVDRQRRRTRRSRSVLPPALGRLPRARRTAGAATADVAVIVAAGPGGDGPGRAVLPRRQPRCRARATTHRGPFSTTTPLRRARSRPAARPSSAVRLARSRLRGSTTPARFDPVSTTVGRAPLVGARARRQRRRCAPRAASIMPGATLLPGGTVAGRAAAHDAQPEPGGALRGDVDLTVRAAAGRGGRARGALARSQRLPAGSGAALARLHHRRAVAGSQRPIRSTASPTSPGGEGSLGDALSPRRGVLLADGAGAATGCRGGARRRGSAEPRRARARPVRQRRRRAAGRAAGDRRPTPRTILDSVPAALELAVATSGSAGSYVVTHRLDSAELSLAAGAPSVDGGAGAARRCRP